jgi:hypothetical protein
MLCNSRKLNHYSSVVQTVAHSISQIKYPVSIYVVNATRVFFTITPGCAIVCLYSDQNLLEEMSRAMPLYASLFTRVVIGLCRSHNAGYRVPQC